STPCSPKYHHTKVHLSPSTATGGTVAHTCPLCTSISTLIGFSALTALLFIQGQGTWGTGLLLAQPLLRPLPSFLHNPGNASHAQLDATHLQQTRLDTAITRMCFDQQGQNLFLHWYLL